MTFGNGNSKQMCLFGRVAIYQSTTKGYLYTINKESISIFYFLPIFLIFFPFYHLDVFFTLIFGP